MKHRSSTGKTTTPPRTRGPVNIDDRTHTHTPLNCGHTFTTQISAPRTGDTVYCGQCHDYQEVTP